MWCILQFPLVTGKRKQKRKAIAQIRIVENRNRIIWLTHIMRRIRQSSAAWQKDSGGNEVSGNKRKFVDFRSHPGGWDFRIYQLGQTAPLRPLMKKLPPQRRTKIATNGARGEIPALRIRQLRAEL